MDRKQWLKQLKVGDEIFVRHIQYHCHDDNDEYIFIRKIDKIDRKYIWAEKYKYDKTTGKGDYQFFDSNIREVTSEDRIEVKRRELLDKVIHINFDSWSYDELLKLNKSIEDIRKQ